MKSEAFASIEKKLQETVAYLDECATKCCCDAKPSYEYIDTQIRYIQSQLNELWEQQYKHLQGHLPKLVGAEQMEKAIKALGLDGNYKVEKQIIYASDTGEPTEYILKISAAK